MKCSIGFHDFGVKIGFFSMHEEFFLKKIRFFYGVCMGCKNGGGLSEWGGGVGEEERRRFWGDLNRNEIFEVF